MSSSVSRERPTIYLRSDIVQGGDVYLLLKGRCQHRCLRKNEPHLHHKTDATMNLLWDLEAVQVPPIGVLAKGFERGKGSTMLSFTTSLV